MEATRTFLDQFRPDHQGAIAGMFFDAVRSHRGKITPAGAVTSVRAELERKLELYGEGGAVSRKAVIEAIDADPEAAEALVLWVQEREARTQEEKEQDRATRQGDGRRRWMGSQPPSQKQLDLLVKLGVDVYPANMLEASELIDANKTW